MVASPTKKYILYCDGASRGNPGPASYGFVLFCDDEIVAQEGGRLGITTNNVAEYEGLIRGLQRSLQLGVSALTVKCDSELMVRQISGEYKVKSALLLPLFQKVRRLLEKMEAATVKHIPREENQLADSLANQALDS